MTRLDDRPHPISFRTAVAVPLDELVHARGLGRQQLLHRFCLPPRACLSSSEDLHRTHSPGLYAKNFKTPTMIISGDEDWRVPIAQSQELFRALKVRGVWMPSWCACRAKRTGSGSGPQLSGS